MEPARRACRRRPRTWKQKTPRTKTLTSPSSRASAVAAADRAASRLRKLRPGTCGCAPYAAATASAETSTPRTEGKTSVSRRVMAPSPEPEIDHGKAGVHRAGHCLQVVPDLFVPGAGGGIPDDRFAQGLLGTLRARSHPSAGPGGWDGARTVPRPLLPAGACPPARRMSALRRPCFARACSAHARFAPCPPGPGRLTRRHRLCAPSRSVMSDTGQRTAQSPPTELAVQLPKPVRLLPVLDALGDGAQSGRMDQLQDGRDEGLRCRSVVSPSSRDLSIFACAAGRVRR